MSVKAAELLKLLKKNPIVDAVSLNYAKQLDAVGDCGGIVPDDSMFDDQWPLCNTGQNVSGRLGTPGGDIDAPEAWAVQEGSGDVVVAVLDTGLDYLHPDLDDNMWVNQAESGGILTVQGLESDCWNFLD